MYSTFLQVHSLFAYVVLATVLIATINAAIGFFVKREYGSKDLRIGLFALIFSHLQLLLGLILYVVTPLIENWKAGGVMKNSYIRQLLLEHPMMVIIGVVFITIGWSLHKKQKTSNRAFGKIALFYALGLVCFLSRIPWSKWLA
ncbi:MULTISPECIES: hypothetical protein [Capnocytophaga]|uniref:50S ribosomal protein L27 n=1 Tax=Capnocytophaga canis TaxID=1848903 RepID=A0A0B7IA65_9FLAO|nr:MULTISPECIES: hypothetical protein [Capnocytophaga]ATA72932.1 hypothetical protein CGC49_06370 [Capnocytophaga sp. H4358]ATA75025.1 hypothetical protein CGC52_06090 [Capnocytophaga sp. H2931]RIY36915.1 hypothetical protein CKY20_05150 [Capnocytophaga canis]CEN43956.1 conserved membrane hypothetical protein [Capnocytophaga canis]CEN47609.1 conserved membrane hypothetical protein [Capnocytophaga canis]